MDTLETAKQTKTAYFIEYVYPIDANRDALNKVQSMIHQRMILTNK